MHWLYFWLFTKLSSGLELVPCAHFLNTFFKKFPLYDNQLTKFQYEIFTSQDIKQFLSLKITSAM